MITEILIDQAAKENKISISDGQINDEIAKVKAQFSSEAEFQSALVQYKLTLDSYKEQMRLRLILARLGEPKPATEAELTAYFNENKAKYDQDEEVNVSHILLKTEDEAKAVLAELAKGADFAKLAKEKSEDPGSKDNGGEIGFAAKGQLVKEFEDAAFKLKPGEISGIVKTQYGYHIIKGIEHRMPKSAVYSDVKKQVADDYAADNTKKPEEIIAQLKSNAKISVASDSYKSFENNPGAK
jgi:foldase protein PrsA